MTSFHGLWIRQQPHNSIIQYLCSCLTPRLNHSPPTNRLPPNIPRKGIRGGKLRSVNSAHLINPMLRVIALYKSPSPAMWYRPLINLFLHFVPEMCEYSSIFLMDLIAEFFPPTQRIVERYILEFWEYID